MSEMILFFQTNSQVFMAGAFWLVLVVLFVNQLRILHRTKKLENNIDEVIERVRDYLAVVMDPEGGEPVSSGEGERAVQEKQRSEEEDSRLISAVLQEIFP